MSDDTDESLVEAVELVASRLEDLNTNLGHVVDLLERIDNGISNDGSIIGVLMAIHREMKRIGDSL